MLPGESPKTAQRQLVDYVRYVSEADPWLRGNPPKVEFKGYYAEPAEIPADHPIVLALSKSFEEATGKEPVVMGHDGAADTRFLINYGETPSVIFGPGTISQMHATNEWVSVEDVITSVKVLALTILSWCGLEG